MSMDQIIEQLDALVTKTVKNISKSQAQEGALLLLELYRQSSDKIKVAEYICTLHFSVCQAFFESAITELQSGQIESICTAIRNNEQYKKNLSYKGTVRGYIAAAVLIVNHNPYGKVVLMNTVADTEKDGLLPPKAVALFGEKVLEYCKAKPLMELGERSWNDNLKREKFRNLVESVLSQAVPPITKNFAAITTQENNAPRSLPVKPEIKTNNSTTVQQPVNEYNKNETTEQKPIVQNTQSFHAKEQTNGLGSVNHEIEALLRTTQKVNCELQTLLRTIVNTNETPSDLRRQITELNVQISALRNQLSDSQRRVTELTHEIGNRDTSIARLRSDNADLTERLTKTLQLDTSANNQELITLRTDISNALKLEYQDYQDCKTKEYSSDQFEAYKASLFRIFKTLKRFNITLD